MRFPRQEYWSRLPCPSLGDLPDPGIEPASRALAGRFFAAEPPGMIRTEENCLHRPERGAVALGGLACSGLGSHTQHL